MIKALILLVVLGIQSCNSGNKSATDSSGCDIKGYNYAVQHLNAPSSAVRIAYVLKEDVREEAKQRGWDMPPGLEAEVYIIEGSNAFGGRLQKAFTVFFWMGDPILCQESERTQYLGIFCQPDIVYLKDALKRKGVMNIK